VVGDVDAGLDEAAMLLEPEPHIPDVPDVSSIPEDVDIAGDVDVPAFDGVDTPGIARVPGSTAVAGVEAPAVVPPPSYIALDPYISAGEMATVEHAVSLLVVGIEMVPAKPVGAGLTPADVISVEANGIPVGEIAEPIPMPSGEVAPIVGVGVTESSTCAIAAALQTTSAEMTAAINDNFIVIFLSKSAPPPDLLNAICGPDSGSGSPSRKRRRRCFYDEVPGRFLHFLERAHIDLPDTFTRYVEFCCKLFERQWFVGQMSRLEYATFAVIQYTDRSDQRILLVVFLVLFDDDSFRRGRLINEMVLPFADFIVLVYRRIDRFVAAQAPIHVDDILVRNIERLCDQRNLIGAQIAAFQCRDLALCRAQLEKQLPLVRGGADFHK
jgi:hypothetical protein